LPGLVCNLRPESQRAFLIEATAWQMALRPVKHFDLAIVVRRRDINSSRSKPADVVPTLPGIDRMQSFFPELKTFLDKREEHPVSLVWTIEERANVSSLPKR